MIMFIDTHCHLDDPALLDRLPEVLRAAGLAGIGKFVVPATRVAAMYSPLVNGYSARSELEIKGR